MACQVVIADVKNGASTISNVTAFGVGAVNPSKAYARNLSTAITRIEAQGGTVATSVGTSLRNNIYDHALITSGQIVTLSVVQGVFGARNQVPLIFPWLR